MSGDRLDAYRSKRHFDVTTEPSGEEARSAASPEGGEATGGEPPEPRPGPGPGPGPGPRAGPGPDAALAADAGGARFVVQEHAARRHHYDVRFEVEGVMASWAVPKGPSYNPSVRRLAVHVEDHPLDYRNFEGAIPAGEYGAGTVIVWDRGTYRNESTERGHPIDLRRAIEKGHLTLWLEGEKLKGGWTLIRTGGQGDNWLMIKRRDEHADPDHDITEEARWSVTSGRRIEDVAADPGVETWTAGTATWQPPMLAVLVSRRGRGILAPDVDWVLERKLDGLRCVAVRNGGRVELWSRNHQSYTARFPAIAQALASLPADNFVVDGEVVAFDEKGRTSFSLLQRPDPDSPPVFCVFDLLHLLGHSTTDLDLMARRSLLAQLVTGSSSPFLQPVETVEGEPAAALADACASGWEGLIAKRADSLYRSGRSGEWCKLKCSASQELVIGGWTDPRGSRQGFGALLLGYHDTGGELRYAGKVGTGFDEATLLRLHSELRRRERKTPPFSDPVKERGVHWATPELVAAVAFTEWTADGRLRHPRFEGLRDDKAASEVVREQGA